MKKSLLILLLLSSVIFGRSLEDFGYPERFIESAKSNKIITDEEFHYDTYATSLGEHYFVLALKERSKNPTVWKTRITNSPQIDWFSIGFANAESFKFGISELQLSGDPSCPKLTLETTSNEVFETNCQVNSIFGGNQQLGVNQLPPNAPTVWDTILWDEPEVLVSYNISGGSFAGGPAKLAVGDSGYVHFFSSVDDGFLRYHRSTDYGKTFEPTVILDDTMGSIIEVVATGDYVYAYVINQFWQVNPQMRLYASSDNGNNFVLAQKIDYGTQSGFAADLNNAYDYQEYGSTDSIMQSKSFDIGQSFEPYTVVTDTVYGILQRPSIAIGNNSIVYTRTGNDTTLTGANVYRSFDLGENWLPFAEDLEPLADLQTPDVFAVGNTFHLCAVPNTFYYFRSEDAGQNFNFEVNLCEPNVNCSAEQFQQITAHNNNVFVNFEGGSSYFNQNFISMLRFSRDNGNNWSQLQKANKFIPTVNGVWSQVSVGAFDSLVNVSYVQVSGNITLGLIEVVHRRGFYKFPLFVSSTDSLNFGLVDSLVQVDTTISFENKGVLPLVISNINFPNEISSQNLQFPLTLLPDSSFNLQLSFSSDSVGVFNDTIKFHTNQQVDSVKNIYVFAEILPVGVSENPNKPNDFRLEQNYPNPFNPTTSISYRIQSSGGRSQNFASLTIFNILGKEVKEWKLDQVQGSVTWNGKDELGNSVSSGVYLYRLQFGKEQITRKMLLLK